MQMARPHTPCSSLFAPFFVFFLGDKPMREVYHWKIFFTRHASTPKLIDMNHTTNPTTCFPQCAPIKFPMSSQTWSSSSQCAPIKFPMSSQTCSSSSQCVPQHGPNNTSLYPIFFAQSSTLATYGKVPKKRRLQIISILGPSKGWLNILWRGQSLMPITKGKKKSNIWGSPRLMNMSKHYFKNAPTYSMPDFF
jgi:hypothetical protein